MANYPTSQPSAAPADHAEVLGEVRAIASTLGLSPQGSFTDVGTRLSAGRLDAGFVARLPTSPQGISATLDRGVTTLASITPASGTLQVGLLPLVAGQVVTSLSTRSWSTAWAGVTHSWVVLADINRVVLAVSADDTTASLTTFTTKTCTLGSPYTVPTTGAYYAGIMVAFSTSATIAGASGFNVNQTNFAPVLAGTSNTAQTTPPAVSATLTALTASANVPYLWAS